jgi:two-component system response regulator NreC
MEANAAIAAEPARITVVIADDHAEARDVRSANGELVEAVRAATEGRTYLQPQLGARLATEPAAPAAADDDLSQRETEVLQLIALGHTNTEIAGQLYRSVRTVESRRAHIQQKLSLSTRAELVRYALDHDLVDLANGAGQ